MQKYLMIILALTLGLSMLGCGGSRVNNPGSVLDREGSAPASIDLYKTELIAGAGGWNDGGWPDHGTDVGSVVVSYSGDTLYVTYALDTGYHFGDGESLHLWVDDVPPVYEPGGVPAPGQFPYAYSPGTATAYTFTLEGMYTGVPLWIMAHAVVCTEGGSGDGSSYWSYQVVNGDHENPEVITIWAGQTMDAGTATLSFFDQDGLTYMTVDISLNAGWYLWEDHFWVGTDCSSYPQNKNGTPNFGHFPYSHTFGSEDDLPVDVDTLPSGDDCDSFTTLALELPNDLAEPWYSYPGITWDANDMAHLCMILHLTLVMDENGDGWIDEDEFGDEETGIAWIPGEHDWFPDDNNRWGGCYCFDVYRTEDGGGGGEGTCDTAWAFEVDGSLLDDNGSMIGNGDSRDEPGWFPTFFGSKNGNPKVHRWGWVIYLGAGAG